MGLLLPHDEASIIHVVEAAKQHSLRDVAGQISSVIDSVKAEPRNLNLTPEHDHVLIIDTMTVLRSMKKTPGMTTICHLKKAFNAKIERMLNGYVESRINFDWYIAHPPQHSGVHLPRSARLVSWHRCPCSADAPGVAQSSRSHDTGEVPNW